MSEATLFVRKASGLVRAWSVFDAFVYATFSINLITLGLFIFSYCWYFGGNLATAIVLGAIFTVFEVVVYASLISIMPRAGGDYVWQSRILGRGLGFILTVTGWWFILWLWVPLYGQILTYEFFTPILGILGLKDAALWFTNTNIGLLVAMLTVCALVFVYIGVGMKWYARIQKFCFWGGAVGLAAVFGLLLFGNNAGFIAAFNAAAPKFGAAPGDTYSAIVAAGDAAGTIPGSLWPLALGASIALVPMLTFFNLWPNWGSTLYGEVRGASDYKRNFWGMTSAIIVTTVLGVIFALLIGKTMGWDFYQKANGAFWSNIFYGTDTALPIWPYPALFAAFMIKSPAIQFIIVLLMSLWWFGWSGTVFLSSTRVIFAAAFDRMLPEWASKVDERTKTPVNALLLMVIPSVIISIMYAFNWLSFRTLVLDATVVIAITFLGTTVAATILPWRQKAMFEGSPVSKNRVAGWLSWLVLLAYLVGAAYLIFTSFKYAWAIIGGMGAVGANWLTWAIVILLGVLTVINAAVLVWVLYYVGKRIVVGEKMPMVTLAGLIFLFFLDWLLVVWFWDPTTADGVASYGIGWSNVTSMAFMVLNYLLAAAIYFGFNAYRKRQGVNVDMLFKEIPVE